MLTKRACEVDKSVVKRVLDNRQIATCAPFYVNQGGEIKHDYIQIQNPKTKRYVKIDKTIGQIVGHKKTPGAYKGIRILKRPKNRPWR